MQKTEQKFFKDRAFYYSTFPITEQAKQGEWNFELKTAYNIAILNFVFDKDEADEGTYCYAVKLEDINTCQVFYKYL